MIPVVWNPHGFVVIDSLPKGEKFTSRYYISNILSQLIPIANESRKRKIVIHADNARPHSAKTVKYFVDLNNMKVAPHPPYSPDIAPSDFYLFGYMKDQMKGESYESADELIHRVTEILNAIDHKILFSVFDEWMKRLEK